MNPIGSFLSAPPLKPAVVGSTQSVVNLAPVEYCRLQSGALSFTKDSGWNKIPFSSASAGDSKYFSLSDNGFKIPAGKAGIYQITLKSNLESGYAINASETEFWLRIKVNNVIYEHLICSGESNGWNGKGGQIITPAIALSPNDIITFDVGIWASSNITISLSTSPAITAATLVYLSPTSGTFVREPLTADRTYYVSTTGSDTNTGLTAGTPFATIQKAVDTVCTKIDMADYQVTIQLADGTYTTGAVLKSYVGVNAPIVKGNTVTPDNVLMNITGKDCFMSNGGMKWIIKDLKINVTTTGFGLVAINKSVIHFSGINFGSGVESHIQASAGSYIKAIGTYKISGSAVRHWWALMLGGIEICGITITIINTPAFSDAFATTDSQGGIYCWTSTFSGSSTGKRYSTNNLGVIHSGAAGSTYLPGNASGISAGGGIYV